MLERTSRAAISYGSTYEAPFDAHVTRALRRRGRRLDRATRRDAFARALTRYRVNWPEADVVTEARLDVRSDADAYHVVVEVVVEEVGDAGIGRRERRFERVIPRRLA